MNNYKSNIKIINKKKFIKHKIIQPIIYEEIQPVIIREIQPIIHRKVQPVYKVRIKQAFDKKVIQPFIHEIKEPFHINIKPKFGDLKENVASSDEEDTIIDKKFKKSLRRSLTPSS